MSNAIAREIEYLVEDLAIDLQRLASTKHIQKLDDLKSLAHLVVNLAFNWVMAWIELSRQFEEPALAQQQQLLQMQSLTQMRLLFHGILNWESN